MLIDRLEALGYNPLPRTLTSKRTRGEVQMLSQKTRRLALSIVSAGLLIVCSSSDAGRSVRTDSSDTAFESQGGFWGDDGTFFEDFASRTEFKLNFGTAAGARFWTVCTSIKGYIRFVTSDTCDYSFPPGAGGNYIAVYATPDLTLASFGNLTRTRGFVDFNIPPARLAQAVPAMRYWWNPVRLVSDTGEVSPFHVQIVLLDRSEGNAVGDFDIELNYGTNLGDVVPADGSLAHTPGFRGFKLGPNSGGPISEPFLNDGVPIYICFRGGKVKASCHQ
jgi:hypothetical protein